MTMTGKEVKRIRKQLELTQVEVATLLGVKQASISKWEKRNIRIAKAFEQVLTNLVNNPEQIVRKKPTVTGVAHASGQRIVKAESLKLSDRIKRIRLNLNMSQHEFAEATSSTIPAVSSWENGKYVPSEKYMIRIAELIKVHPNEVRYGSLENFVFEFVGNPSSLMFPKASMNDAIHIVNMLKREVSPYDFKTLVSVVNFYRSNEKSTSVLPGYFTTLVSA